MLHKDKREFLTTSKNASIPENLLPFFQAIAQWLVQIRTMFGKGINVWGDY